MMRAQPLVCVKRKSQRDCSAGLCFSLGRQIIRKDDLKYTSSKCLRTIIITQCIVKRFLTINIARFSSSP